MSWPDLSQVMWFQKISKPPTRIVIWFVPPPPGIYRLTSYFPFKNLAVETTHPLRISNGHLRVGRDIF